MGEQQETKEPGRNEPCSCGSGKKYKKCCGEERQLSALQCRKLFHMLLVMAHGMSVPAGTLDSYPDDCEFAANWDAAQQVWTIVAKNPPQFVPDDPKVVGSDRRILVPKNPPIPVAPKILGLDGKAN